MKAKLKGLKDRLTPGRNDAVRMIIFYICRVTARADYDDKGRVAVVTGRAALGLKELVPGRDPVIE